MSGAPDDRDGDALRALTEAQRRGIRAASTLFDGLLADLEARQIPAPRVDEALAAFTRAADGGPAGAVPLTDLRAAAARAIDLYADLLRATVDVYADAVEATLRAGGATVSAAARGEPIALTGAPGDEAAAPVWIHNGTDAPLHGVALRVTDLAAHDGATVGGGLAAFSPAALDVGAGESVSATLALVVPPAVPRGAYHGLVLAGGLPAASLPVLLEVR